MILLLPEMIDDLSVTLHSIKGLKLNGWIDE